MIEMSDGERNQLAQQIAEKFPDEADFESALLWIRIRIEQSKPVSLVEFEIFINWINSF